MSWQVAVDQLLELLVVPSFSRIGYGMRRRLFGWKPAESWSLRGRTIVITGPTSGLGREAAGSFARMGARLVLVGRDPDRLERTASELRGESADAEIHWVEADMASLASVRSAVREILAGMARIDVIVDNAGAMFAEREVTDEGFERTFATMVLGPFVLVAGLLPRLLESPDPRIVAVTSGGMYTQGLPLDELDFEHGTYDGPRAYARAKRAQVALVREWARRLHDVGLTANAMHPGWADTPGLEASLPGFRRLVGGLLRTPAEGVDTLIWLAAADEARAGGGAGGADGASGGDVDGAGGGGGRLFLDRRERPFDRVRSTRLSADARRILWERVLRLTGESDPIRRSVGSSLE